MPHYQPQRKPASAPAPKTASRFTPPPVIQAKVVSKELPEWQQASSYDLDILNLNQAPIQAKLTIGEPNNRYEQEADQVAAQVVQRMNEPESVQREALPEEEELQMKPEAIQRELLEEEELQMKPEAIQRELPEEEELQMKPQLQRQGVSGAVSPELEQSLNRAKSGGQSLDPQIQTKMGQAMGADFSGVKVHTDNQADQLNQSIQAKAFTTGQDVFFRQGEYNPGSSSGQELIAHELTHVMQQNHQVSQPSNVTHIDQKNQIQRFTGVTEDEWSRQSAAHFMMNKQSGLDKQNVANASVWYNTLFSPGLDPKDESYDPRQEEVLKEQQAMLKRHFLSQAVFGVQGGTQYKKGKNEESYQPIEKFKKDGTSANLATLASGGGRFNYRSTDGSGEAFNKFLMFGNSQNNQTLEQARDTTNKSKGGMKRSSPMGAYQRIGTHGESFKDGKIQEVDVTTGGIDSTGFDLPIGGVGLNLKDQKGRDVTTGYQGISHAKRRGKHIGDDYKKYQTGHGFHRYASDGNNSLTQIAFEGSAPHMDNIHGGSHDVMATIGKKLFGGQSEKTLTGQDKRSKLGLPKGVGGVKADVTQEQLGKLEEVYGILERIKLEDTENGEAIEKKFYQALLTSTTADERDNLIKWVLDQAPSLTKRSRSNAVYKN